MSLCTAFLLLFVGLKLSGHIDWSWWLVLIPLYLSVIKGIILGIFQFIVEETR